MKILAIGNPVSGGGRARRLAARLVECLARRGHDVELCLTGQSGDARERAAAVATDVQRLIVVGGDGTLNEVLNGLADPSQIPLIQLATGTANILAHELGLPWDAEGVARLIDEGAIRRIDMGLVGDRRFLMVVSAGFDAMVTREIQRRRRSTLGYFGYVLPILRVLRGYRPPRLRVEVDDGDTVEGGLVVVSNTRNYGGLFTVADRARCDSGHLDVCVITKGSLAAVARAAIGGLTGGISRQKGVHYLTGRRIRVDSAEPLPVEVDGDYFGSTPIEITLRPSSVPVVVPPG